MEKDLSSYRKSYQKGALLIKDTPSAPMELFKRWFNEADRILPEKENNAMALTTIGLDGYPKSRIVLLKKITEEGFIFFTNYNSDKGKSIDKTANVCLSFFWQELERQIIIKGKAEKVAPNISDDYFKSRPIGSQLGALVSNQSEVIKNRGELEDKLQELETIYKNKKIERPKHWGGFIVRPIEIEFWQGRPNRLHDRIQYQLQANKSWIKNRLSP